LEPVKLLDEAAAAVAAGDYRYRVRIGGTDELARLATTFNGMCESIERAQAERIRQEQMNTIARLGTSLVHDLRNPLAAIYGGAEMLIDSNLPEDQSVRVARSIYRASRRVQELLRDLLHVSRGEKRAPERCRLRDLVETAAEPITAANAQIQIDVNVARETEVIADRTRVERIFTNLFVNASDAMNGAGTISVTDRTSAKHVDVFVRDTGPGIPPELKSDLMKPFATAKGSGLGLGLALSRQAMTEIGGDLFLVETNGEGACFCVRFVANHHGGFQQTPREEAVTRVQG
jgi:signal transduction histidine kinase